MSRLFTTCVDVPLALHSGILLGLMALPSIMRTAWLGAMATVAVTFSGSALADDAPEPASLGPVHPPAPDVSAAAVPQTSASDRRQETLDRPFLYLVDPRLPEPLTSLVSYEPSYTSTEAAVRPLAANVSRSGLVDELHFELGVLDRVAAFVGAYLAPPLDREAGPRGAFEGGVRTLLTAPDSRTFRVALDAAYLRDFAETSVVYGAGTATYDLGRVRFAAMGHAEHAFAPGRDAIDLYVDVGTSARVVDRLRIGAEYVVQEIEDAWSHDAEGGARDFASASIAWSGDRVSLAAGPAFGLGGGAPRLLGRAIAAVAF